ncbi:MAG: DedA family protein [Candidatus Rokubacteria bacterium]|nr:DedA family protein [Candidatus Rokubacteria bacterium]
MMALLESYAYGAVFGAVLLDTLGVPVPGEIVLLAAGFLVSAGKVQLLPTILLAGAGAIVGDCATYWLGRRVGVAGERRLVGLFCTWTACTLGSARCVERAEGLLRRFRGWVVLVAKFIAGARVFVPPIAGASTLSFGRFLWFDALGSLLWTSLVVGTGALVGREWEVLGRGLEAGYRVVGLALIALLASYLVWKVARRRRYGAPSLMRTGALGDPASDAEKLWGTTRSPLGLCDGADPSGREVGVDDH